MLNVNTIEFGGRKAVINSYSDHPLLIEDMNRQRAQWADLYPNATVRTERMTEGDTIALVALCDADKEERRKAGERMWYLFSRSHDIAKASQGLTA